MPAFGGLFAMMTLDIELHKQILDRLHERGVTLAQVARELKKSPTLVTYVSQGRCRSRPVETAIARHLDCDAADLWPTRYQKKEGK